MTATWLEPLADDLGLEGMRAESLRQRHARRMAMDDGLLLLIWLDSFYEMAKHLTGWPVCLGNLNVPARARSGSKQY